MTVTNPFPGLRAFEAEDSHLFFGRETATDELLRKLRDNRFITVIGTSGSGKSSLVKAGILPDLYGGYMVSAGSNWRIALLRPGNSPVHALAAALVESGVFGTTDQETSMQVAINETVLKRGAKGLIEVVRQARMQADNNLLVVVDQFEELFRFIHTPGSDRTKEEAAAFVKLLLEASAQVELPIYVILTMRSEYLGDCTQFRDLPEAINEGQYLIPRMTRDQKRQAITGPVAVGGAKISPRLVQRLLNDIGDNPDQLPIMQHAMMRSWEYWQKENQLSEPIDLRHYDATGGMDKALSRHADEAFEELGDNKTKQIAEFIFKRLTGQGADNREIRFPTTVNELCSVSNTDEATIVKVLNIFRQEGRSFLMPPASIPLTSDTLIDISHESLIRIWHRLRLWVDEEAQSASIYRRLSETALLFSQKKAGLWRDPDLQISLEWRKDNQPNKIWAQRYDSHFSDAMSFINKSRAVALRRKMILQTATVLLPLVLVGYYVYELKRDVLDLNTTIVNKEANILDLQSTVSDSKEVMVDLAQKLTQDTMAIRDQGPVDSNTEIIVQEVNEAVAKLEETVDQVEQMSEEVAVETATQLEGKTAEVTDPVANLEETVAQSTNQETPTQQVGKAANIKEAFVKFLEKVNLVKKSTKEVELETAAPLAGDTADTPETVAKLPEKAKLVEQSAEQATVETETPLTEETETVDFAALQGNSPLNGTNISEFADFNERCLLKNRFPEVETITWQLQKWQSCLNQADLTTTDKEFINKEIEAIKALIKTSASIHSNQDFVTCKRVSALTPKECGNQFSTGKVYLFTRVATPRNEMLKLVWYKEQQEFGTRQLAVRQNANGYRTFAWKRFSDSGNYRVALFNQKKVLIAERKFVIK